MAYGRTSGANAPKPKKDNPFGDSDFYSKSIKPNFALPGDGKSKKAQKAGAASGSLGNAEKSAVSDPITKTGTGVKDFLKAEAGSIIDNVRGVNSDKNNKKTKGKIKKGGPVAIIIAAFLAVGGAMFSGQSLMPFSLVAQFIENFDSIKVSTSLRSRSFFRHQTNGNLTKNCIHTTFFGKHKFKMTSKQKTKLKAQGIEEVEINGKTYLAFDDGSPSRTLIAPDNKLASKIGDGVEIDGEKFGKTLSFDDAYSKLADFRNGYNKASRTWKGSVGAWFDRVTLNFLNRIDATRNHFKNFRKRVEDAEAGNAKTAQAAELEVAKADMQKGPDEVSGQVRIGDVETTENEDGTGTKTAVEVEDGEARFKAGMDVDDIKAETKKIAKAAKATKASSASTVTNIAQMGTNTVCAVSSIIGTISVLAIGYESIQLIKLITGFTEAFQKTQYGEGADSPTNVLATALVTTAKTKDWKLSDEGEIVVDNNADPDEDYEVVEYDTGEEITAMQSAGIAAIYGNTAIDQNDPSVQKFNLTGALGSIFEKFGTTAAAFTACTITKIIAATASIAATIAEAILTEGTSLISGLAVGLFASIAIGSAVTIAVRLLVPKIVAVVTRDLISNLVGGDLGNALVKAINDYLAGNHRSGGGSLTNKNRLLKFGVEQQKVIADNAEYERTNRSPFDITSKYTFLGSLLTKFTSLYTASYSASGFLTTIGNITRNSLTSILPSASAITATNLIEGTGDCPYLESIGAVGDAFCNPYVITDVESKTIDENPVDIINKVYALGGIEENPDANGTPIIKEGSKLAKFVKYCSQRSSSFGFADQNISNDFQIGTVESDSEGFNTVTNSAIGAIPVVGDLLDVAQNTNVARNIGWITGKACVAGNTSGGDVGAGITSDTPNWAGEGEYYQRFLEDQRFMESIDPEYKSAQVAYLEKYYTEHPLDNSYEGILARYSGLTKETVVATLDAIDYMNYIANYDPSTRYDFTDKNEHHQKTYIDSENNVADSENVILQYAIVYNDTRNRTATV